MAAWSRGGTITAIAEGLACKRQAASKSLRIARTKLSDFAAAVARGLDALG